MLDLTIVKIESTPEGGTQITAEVGITPLTTYDTDDQVTQATKAKTAFDNVTMIRNLHLGFAQLNQRGG